MKPIDYTKYEGHTPRPWYYNPSNDWGVVEKYKKYLGRGCQIARANPYLNLRTEEEMAEHRKNGSDPVRSNALLIAAAPELLQACKDRDAEIEMLRDALKKFVGQFDCYKCTGTAEEALRESDANMKGESK